MAVEAILLGQAQDAGVPQAGCSCANCSRARTDASERRLVACLGLIDHEQRQCWMLDATPDFRAQLQALQTAAPESTLCGISLTHAHVGHYTGLIHLGPEAMNAAGLPVHASERMARFLRANQPWAQLIENGNIALRLLAPLVETRLSPALQVIPLPVPHRDEFSDNHSNPLLREGAERRWLAERGLAVGARGDRWQL